jgi:hypothetical protein
MNSAQAMISDGLPVEAAAKYSGIPADKLRQSIAGGKP